MTRDIRSMPWEELIIDLRSGTLASDEIGPAIVRIGKTDDPARKDALKEVVTKYITHPDSWARREAIWFLGSWGKFAEESPLIIDRMLHDPDEDNRAFASTCLGGMYAGSKNREILNILAHTVRNQGENPALSASAFGAFVRVYLGKQGSDLAQGFDIGTKGLDDIDWAWLDNVHPVEQRRD